MIPPILARPDSAKQLWTRPGQSFLPLRDPPWLRKKLICFSFSFVLWAVLWIITSKSTYQKCKNYIKNAGQILISLKRRLIWRGRWIMRRFGRSLFCSSFRPGRGYPKTIIVPEICVSLPEGRRDSSGAVAFPISYKGDSSYWGWYRDPGQCRDGGWFEQQTAGFDGVMLKASADSCVPSILLDPWSCVLNYWHSSIVLNDAFRSFHWLPSASDRSAFILVREWREWHQPGNGGTSRPAGSYSYARSGREF